jgi:hypothetical protein
MWSSIFQDQGDDHMNGRSIVGLIFSLLVVAVLIGVGVGIYQAGIAQGIVDAQRVPAGAAVPVAGYGYGWGFHGFGFLGLLFPILFFFLIFGLIRAAFWRGRGWGPGWGRGYGGWGKGYGPMDGGPDAWREERERRIADLHKRLHEDEAAGGSTGSPGSEGPPPAR